MLATDLAQFNSGPVHIDHMDVVKGTFQGCGSSDPCGDHGVVEALQIMHGRLMFPDRCKALPISMTEG